VTNLSKPELDCRNKSSFHIFIFFEMISEISTYKAQGWLVEDEYKITKPRPAIAGFGA
jgi:hypothetical protein